MLRILIVTIIMVSSNAWCADQVWRCDGDVFTTSQREADTARCEKFSGSKVCGSGGNKFFSPSNGATANSSEDCSPSGESHSPMVTDLELASVRDGKKRQERTLKSTTSKAPQPTQSEEDDPFRLIGDLLDQLPSQSSHMFRSLRELAP